MTRKNKEKDFNPADYDYMDNLPLAGCSPLKSRVSTNLQRDANGDVVGEIITRN
jgi:hypothetical protein